MRIFWTILAGAAALAVLALIAVAVTVSTVDVNSFVAPMQSKVKAMTGRDLTVRGGIDLKLSLQPRLVLRDVTLSNAPWGKAQDLLTAKEIDAEIALLPLLKKRFDIVRFKLVEPTIALETDADGRGNWEFGGVPSLGAAAQAASEPAAPGGASALQTLGIGDLAIDRGTMTYRDGATGNVTRVAIDELSVHARDPGSPISASFRGQVDDIALTLEGNLGPLEQLVQRRWPYPIAARGDVNGQQAVVSTKMAIGTGTVTLQDLDLALGSSKATGQVSVVTGGARPKLLVKLNVATLALADLPLVAAAAAAAKAAPPPSRFLFPDTPVPLAKLRAFDADGDVVIGRLQFADGQRADNVLARFTLANGRLDAPTIAASAFGGSAKLRLVIDAAPATPTITVAGEVRDVDLGAVLAALGDARDTKGGKTTIAVDLALRGTTPRQWAAGASGLVTATVGAATLSNAKFNVNSAVDRLGEAINPFRRSDPTTELECAAARLPLADGIAHLDRSVALETAKVGVIVSGTLDLRNETLDVSFNPRVRKGIAIEIPQVAELVRLKGPFTAPAVSIDAKASAATVARLGAAVGTSGLSLLGEALLAKAEAATTGNLCQVALAAKAVPAGTSAAGGQDPVTRGVDDLGKALGGLFKH